MADQRAFAGVKVLDLTRVLAGPFCAYQLALLGAEVIKIEPPGKGETVRWRSEAADPSFGQQGLSLGFMTQSSNKRFLSLDLNTPEGRDVFLKLAAECDVDVANFNSPGQIVLSGENAKIDSAIAAAKERGIRIAKKLNVAGAYHSRLMQSAADALAPTLAATPMQPPRFPIVANVTARPVTAPAEIRNHLSAQVTGSVRWTETIEFLVDVEKIELFLELGPGGVLAGLIKRTRKETPVLSITDCATLDAALAQLRG